MTDRFFGFDNFDKYEQELIMSKMKNAKNILISITVNRVSVIIDGEFLVDRPSYHAVLMERFNPQVDSNFGELLDA